MDFLKKLPTPEELAKIYPLSKGMAKKKQQHDSPNARRLRPIHDVPPHSMLLLLYHIQSHIQSRLKTCASFFIIGNGIVKKPMKGRYL